MRAYGPERDLDRILTHARLAEELGISTGNVFATVQPVLMLDPALA